LILGLRNYIGMQRICCYASNRILEKMITALIRTHPGREESTGRAILSCMDELINYKVYKGGKVSDYSYNLYCNELKSQVEDGWFFFLDSDDFIIKGSVDKLCNVLYYSNKTYEDKALIVQMLRNGRPKPREGKIEKGKIGMPCMILHSKHKTLADVTATEWGDYDWIKAVTDKIGFDFVPIPLVDAGKRGRGK
jgi:hypothetical protein